MLSVFSRLRFPILALLAWWSLFVPGAAQRVEGGGGDPPECVAIYDHLFETFVRWETHEDQADWPSLFPLIDEAKSCFGDHRSARAAHIWDMESSLYFKLARHTEAQRAINTFFEVYGDYAIETQLNRVHRLQALLYTRRGQPVEAVQELVRATRYIDSLSVPQAARLLIRIGEGYVQIDDLQLAERFYNRADSLVTANIASNPDLVETRATILSAQADLVAQQPGPHGQREASLQAVRLLEQAAALIPAGTTNSFSMRRRARILLELSSAYRRVGEPELALRVAEEARLLGAPFATTYPYLRRWPEQQIGMAYQAMGLYDQAREHFLIHLEASRSSGSRESEVVALKNLGSLERDVAENTPKPDYSTAMAYFRQAIDLGEINRQTMGNLEWSAAEFADDQSAYRNLIELLVVDGRYEEAFLILDETRARYLRDLRDANRLQESIDDETRTVLDSLQSIIDHARYELLEADVPLLEQEELRHQIVSAQREFERTLGFAPQAPDSLTLSEVRETLGRRNATLLTYYLEPEYSFVFAVRKDTLVVSELGAPRDSIDTWMAILSDTWIDGSPSSQSPTRVLHDLHQALIAPVQDLLVENDPLIIIPEGRLTGLPFAALLTDEAGANDARRYLVRRHPISMELSAALLVEEATLDRSNLPQNLLAMGRSEFDSEMIAQTRALSEPLSNLPNVPDELRYVSSHVPGGSFSVNEEATEAQLYRQLHDSRVVHLASHAVVNPTLPLYSFISLWNSEEEDGTLFLYELQGHRVPSELVVLSGCSTARGEGYLGEGMVGLQHAFRAAGAASILATLWQVDDRAMTVLIDLFYAYLRDGIPKDEALRQAQLAFLDSEESYDANPYLWAPATLYGNADPVSWRRGGFLFSPVLWATGGVLLLLCGLLASRLRGHNANG